MDLSGERSSLSWEGVEEIIRRSWEGVEKKRLRVEKEKWGGKEVVGWCREGVEKEGKGGYRSREGV